MKFSLFRRGVKVYITWVFSAEEFKRLLFVHGELDVRDVVYRAVITLGSVEDAKKLASAKEDIKELFIRMMSIPPPDEVEEMIKNVMKLMAKEFPGSEGEIRGSTN